jgi:hypothetical protein
MLKVYTLTEAVVLLVSGGPSLAHLLPHRNAADWCRMFCKEFEGAGGTCSGAQGA